jgi:hypothetical protein
MSTHDLPEDWSVIYDSRVHLYSVHDASGWARAREIATAEEARAIARALAERDRRVLEELGRPRLADTA